MTDNKLIIDNIIEIEEIPMLGTWKVDHVQLKQILENWTTKQPTKSSKKTDKKETKKTNTRKNKKE